MTDQPDPLAAFPDFTAAVGDRLEAGAKAYGDRSFGLHPTQLLDELQQEALDLAGWGYVIWRRLQAAQEAAARLTPKREPMIYHAAGKRSLTVIRDTREKYAPTWPEGVTEQVAKLDVADYSAVGLSATVGLELKWSLSDLAGCVTVERERFETMPARLSRYPVKALIVAASERDVWAHRYHSKLAPKALIASTWAWAAQYSVPTIWTHDAVGATEAIIWFLRRAQAKAAKAANQKPVA